MGMDRPSPKKAVASSCCLICVSVTKQVGVGDPLFGIRVDRIASQIFFGAKLCKSFNSEFRSQGMGSQTDRSRTYWTTTMERYFIDLMIEQMHRGNRTGHTFSKQAWTDMLTLFNSKFGSQYDKDVLKGRYTNLWKQFNEVKNLLNQSEFSWDEARQMVIADDSAWDAYIKVHPDARPYRTKAVLNFNDLCSIYGYTNADGRYSLSSHDIDFDNEIQAENLGDGMGSVAPSVNDRSRTEWSRPMDQYFIELMLDQIGRGNRTDSTFNKQAWTDMLDSFNAKFGAQHGKRVLRHRHKKLWKYYTDMTNILKQNGFSWDETQHMIIATNDGAWDAYIKSHPQARTYRTKMMPNYNDLGLIYGNAVDDGIQSQSLEDKDLVDGMSEIKTDVFVVEEKGNQASSTSDRTRTYWTPPMDRYLIDLLLDQLHRGNKLGQTFISQAWIDMAASFNANFRSHHDKDVLKNRYKHLRRQYNDIKTLLEHSGFLWDEAREIITAEDCVWEAYTKKHPDARPYRVKTVPSYHKLCVIFGEDNFDGRYSRLARSADLMCEMPVLMTGSGEGKDDQYIDTLDWTPEMDHLFIELMIEQDRQGNRIDHAFGDEAWNHIIGLFNESFGLQCDRYALESRYFSLMKQYDDINNILNRSGFGWDEAEQMITAEDDVWEAYIKENPGGIGYRGKFLGSYSGLCKMYGNREFDHHDLLTIDGIVVTDHDSQKMDFDLVSDDLQLLAADIQIQGCDEKRKLETVSDMAHPNKVQKIRHETISSEITKLVSGASMENAINALQSIADIDDELLLDACDLLEDERKAKTFLALDVSLRKKWLLRKLRS